MGSDEHSETDDIGIDADGVYRFTHDWTTGGSLSGTLIEGLAAVAAQEPAVELEQLYQYVDPDALDSLFRPTKNGPRRGHGYVSFSYSGLDVTVHSDGAILVRPNAPSL